MQIGGQESKALQMERKIGQAEMPKLMSTSWVFADPAGAPEPEIHVFHLNLNLVVPV